MISPIRWNTQKHKKVEETKAFGDIEIEKQKFHRCNKVLTYKYLIKCFIIRKL